MMNIFDAIYGRVSVGKVKADPVPRDLIEKLLDAGAQAPNHYKVRPWRFVVMTGAGRERFGEAMAQSFRAKFPEVPEEALQKERAKPLRAPLVIAVTVDLPADPKVDAMENVAAAAAACQNILLAAHAQGLGAIWRTGDSARDPLIKQFLGVAPEQQVLGFLYIGYPEVTPEPKERPSAADRTSWVV